MSDERMLTDMLMNCVDYMISIVNISANKNKINYSKELTNINMIRSTFSTNIRIIDYCNNYIVSVEYLKY